MKNANYNLIKMLLAKLDDTWRVEKHYAADAERHGCKSCAALMEKIAAEDQKHVAMIKEELERHIKDKKFD